MGIVGVVNFVWQSGDVIVLVCWYYYDESVYINEDFENSGVYILFEYYVKFLEE